MTSVSGSTTDRLIRQGRTNWRALIVMAVFTGAISLALYWGFTAKRGVTKIIERPQCFADGAGRPSKGCEELAGLLAQTCRLRPVLCSSIVATALREVPRSARPVLRDEIERALGRSPSSRPRPGAGSRRPPSSSSRRRQRRRDPGGVGPSSSRPPASSRPGLPATPPPARSPAPAQPPPARTTPQTPPATTSTTTSRPPRITPTVPPKTIQTPDPPAPLPPAPDVTVPQVPPPDAPELPPTPTVPTVPAPGLPGNP